jgi:hypothetical protein
MNPVRGTTFFPRLALWIALAGAVLLALGAALMMTIGRTLPLYTPVLTYIETNRANALRSDLWAYDVTHGVAVRLLREIDAVDHNW